MNPRDLRLRQRSIQAKKADAKPRYRSVICAADGSRTSGSVWADEDNKAVWHQLFGSGGVGRARCETLVPELGLGVIVTPTDDKLGWEVVEDDPFLRQTATDNRNYQTIQPSDLQPGGRLMLWVDSRVIMPLAVYDTPGTLQVNVISGWYPYTGVRTFFAGQAGYDLTSHVPGGGLTRYVGLYLDSANTLQAVDGATIAIGSTPAEPSWPAGAFQLAVVQLDNGQTSIDFADDILDRRMAWADLDSFSGWPFAHIITVSTTNPDADYSTLAAALAAYSSGDIILLDAESYSITGGVTLTQSVTIACPGPGQATITTASNDVATILLSTAGQIIWLYNIVVTNTGAGTNSYALRVTQGTINALNCTIKKLSGAATNSYGAKVEGGTLRLRECDTEATTGTNKYGVYADTGAGQVYIYGGTVKGDTFDLTTNSGGSSIFVEHALLFTTNRWYQNLAGNLLGEFYDQSGNVRTIDTTGHSDGVWLHDESAILRIKEADIPTAITAAATSGDIIALGPDTYTAPNVAGGITVDESLSIVGLSPQETVITRADDSSAVMTISDTPVTLRNLTVQHTGGSGAGTSTNIANSQAALVLDNLYVTHTAGTDGNHIGLSQSAGDSLLRSCKFNISGGTVVNYAIYLHTAGSTCVLEDGEILAGQLVTAHASAVIELRGVKLASGVTIDTSGGGTIKGWYVDAYNRIVRIEPIGIHNVRLTLETGVPVSTSDQTAKTTIYATPYEGNTIEVFNGIGWIEAPFTELSLSLSGFTADKNSDLWVYDNAGTLTLERTEWTNDTTRATALATQDGRYVKSGATTRFYLGTFRTTGTTGQCEDSLRKRFVWNYYNRASRPLVVSYSASHTYNTATWRPFNNSQANSQVELVQGVNENSVFGLVGGDLARSLSTDGVPLVGAGLDVTNTTSTLSFFMNVLGEFDGCVLTGNLVPGIGYHFICLVEIATPGTAGPTFASAFLQVAYWG